MLGTLRQRNFALLWLGGLVSFVGDWVLFIALPVFVYDLAGICALVFLREQAEMQRPPAGEPLGAVAETG